MLNNYFKAPRSLARLRCGPAKPYLDDFITWLESQGYRRSAIRHHVREVVQFTNLAEAEGLAVRDLDRVRSLDFVAISRNPILCNIQAAPVFL